MLEKHNIREGRLDGSHQGAEPESFQNKKSPLLGLFAGHFSPKGQARALMRQQRNWKRPFTKHKFAKNKRSFQTYGRIGNLEVRLATRKKEIKKAQRLRYNVFYKEMSASPDTKTKLKRRDSDSYDKICDHLLVLDHNAKSHKYPFAKTSKIVGTYRILQQEQAAAHGGFYTQAEYDIAPLINRKRRTHKFLELGRSCVLKSHRNKRSVELLWQGLWSYICEHQADVVIGCASFEGVDPKEHALALSYLHHHARAPEEWRVKAHAGHYVDMNMMPAQDIDMKKALRALPPLIKGYLRVGAFIGDGAVIDHQFGTTDIFVILPIEAVDARYLNHFDDRKNRQADINYH